MLPTVISGSWNGGLPGRKNLKLTAIFWSSCDSAGSAGKTKQDRIPMLKRIGMEVGDDIPFIVGYVGSVGIATLSDAVIPYLEGRSLHIAMEFHLPFLETEVMPFIGVPEWILVNAAAVIGIVIGFFKPNTRLPHLMHILLSTWASLFGFTAFGTADWLPLLPILFVFLFLAVWIPCCVSDIVFPLLWVKGEPAHQHKFEHTH